MHHQMLESIPVSADHVAPFPLDVTVVRRLDAHEKSSGKYVGVIWNLLPEYDHECCPITETLDLLLLGLGHLRCIESVKYLKSDDKQDFEILRYSGCIQEFPLCHSTTFPANQRQGNVEDSPPLCPK